MKNQNDNADDPTMKLLRDPVKMNSAINGMLTGDYKDAPKEAQDLWSFVWEELVPKAVPAPGNVTENSFHSSCPGEVDATALMKCVNVSDEGLVLTILLVKGENFVSALHAAGDDMSAITTGDDSAEHYEEDNNSRESSSSSASGKRKRRSSEGEKANCL